MTGPTVQTPVLDLLGIFVPLKVAKTAPDLDGYHEWLNGCYIGWIVRCRTQYVVPAPGLLASTR